MIASMTSTMSRIGMSVMCGPCQLPQHRWKRIRSCGRPRIAWLSASTRTIENFLYSSTVGSGLIMSQFSAIAGSSSCRTKPGLEDRLVFLPHRIGAGVEQLLLGLVVGIADP